MAEINRTLYIEDGVLRDLEQDIFGHKHIADAVVESILHTRPPFTIGIFGGWGAGKSSLLDIVGTKLANKKIVTATIDAWRYSSSNNLRRAFLVHVAKVLTPGLLDELREELFSSKQKTELSRPSRVSLSKKPWGQKLADGLMLIFRLAYKFTGLLALLSVITFLIFSVINILENSGFQNFWRTFDWQNFQDRLFSLAFIPLVLAIIDDIRLYFVQQPVTVIQERIDADELFSQYFDRVVEEKTKGIFSKDRLVIFVDNLDRLSDEKMVEALEGLKTYLNNPKCIFVVACDDNVVRSVVNNSGKLPRFGSEGKEDASAGEHYLDKFFQQTFRLPEHMSVSLHDFAMRNFATTMLYDELAQKDVDINYLLSIILPSHVNSPRKVKRLLNEFIALFEIVKRRESDKDGQLRQGQLSANVEALGKFSTLRAEFPEFYQLLIRKPALLGNITESFQSPSLELGEKVNEIAALPNLDRLLLYLRKTESILIDDIDSYIWLSQDALSLGLSNNLVNQLRHALVNNDVAQFEKIMGEGENAAAKILVIRVASRIAQKFIGVEQQNSVRVLAYLLPKFDDSIRVEIAHIVATMMTTRLDDFSAREILNVLRWAKRGGIETQRKKLIDQVLSKLDDQATRNQAFISILENADVIEQNNGTERVKLWLVEILKSENQVVKDGMDEEVKNSVTSNREFAEWLISQAGTYSEKDLVINSFFSSELVDYSVSRLLGIGSTQDIYLNEEGVGQDINSLFKVLAERVIKGVANPNYWNGILKIIGETQFHEDLDFALGHVKDSMDFIPINLVETFVVSSFLAVRRISKRTDEEKLVEHELSDMLQRVMSLTDDLREKKREEFIPSQLEKIPDCISELMSIPALEDDLLNFADRFARKYGAWKADLFIRGILLALSESNLGLEVEIKVINKIIDLDNFISDKNRSSLLSRIDFLVSSNEQDKIDSAIVLLDRMVNVEAYRQQLEGLSITWLEKLSPDAVSILQSKTKMFHLLMNNKLLSSDAYVERIVGLLPFSGNKDQLHIVFEEVDQIKQIISQEKGKMLFSAVLANVGILGSEFPKALDISSLWVDNAEESEQLSFDSNIVALYKNAPNIHLPIQLVSWSDMTVDQIKDHLVQIYLKEIDDNLKANRSMAAKNAINVIDIDERKEAVLFIWNKLINDRDAAEDFMYVVKASLTREAIRDMRKNSVDIIRENTDPVLSVNNLRLLAATIRDGLDDVDMIVNLFINLFGRGADDVQMALNHVSQCLGSFNLGREHKYDLSEAMSHAVTRSDEEIRAIEDKAREINLRWFRYKRNKDKDGE